MQGGARWKSDFRCNMDYGGEVGSVGADGRGGAYDRWGADVRCVAYGRGVQIVGAGSLLPNDDMQNADGPLLDHPHCFVVIIS